MPSPYREVPPHLSRSPDPEPRRRKRYSLRIEFLDDEDDAPRRNRGTPDQPHGSRRGTPSSAVRVSSGTGSEQAQENIQASRASVSSNTAVVGVVDRDESLPPQAQSRVSEQHRTRSRATPASEFEEEQFLSAMENHSPACSRQVLTGDHAGANQPGRSAQRVLTRDRSDIGGQQKTRYKGKSYYRDIKTQTDLKACDLCALTHIHRPPTGIGYPDGSLQAQNFAAIQDLHLHQYPSAQPPPPFAPTPSSRRRSQQPPRTPSLVSSRLVREREREHERGRSQPRPQHREHQHQHRQSWRSWPVFRWLFGGVHEPLPSPPPSRSVSRISMQSRRSRR